MIISTEDIVEYLQGWQRRSGEAMNGDQHQKVGQSHKDYPRLGVDEVQARIE